MYTSSIQQSTLMKIVASLFVICCIVSTSTGAEITDDIDTSDLDRNLRSAVSHFLRGGRSAPGASHFLRGRKDLDDGELADEDEDPYLRGLRGNSISHFLRGRRSKPVNHFLRGKKEAASGFNHFLRGGRAGVNHFLRGRKAEGVNHFLRGRKSAVNHFLRGKKSASDEEETNEGVAYEEDPSYVSDMDTLY